MSDLFNINKFTFEAGFKWTAVAEFDTAQIKKFLSENDHNCYALAKNDESVGGGTLGTKVAVSKKKSSHSLAAFVFELIEEQFGVKKYIFIHEIENDPDNRLYYLNVENGYIQDDSDVIVSQDEAMSRIAIADTKGEVIYLDSSRASFISNGVSYNDLSIKDTLDEGYVKPSSSTRVTGLNDGRDKLLKGFIVAVALFALLYLSYFTINYAIGLYKDSKKKNESLMTKSQIALQNKKAKEAIVAQRLMLKTKTLSPAAISNSCIKSYFEQDGVKSIGGWKLYSVKCKPNGLINMFIQEDMRGALSPTDFEARVSSYDRMKVTMSPNGRWLGKATVTNTIGFVNNSMREGLLPEDLPTHFDIQTTIFSKLRDLKLKGIYFGDVQEAPEQFTEEQDIPPELLYTVGSVPFVLSSLDQVQLVSDYFNYPYVQLREIELLSDTPINISGVNDKSLKYILKLSFFYR